LIVEGGTPEAEVLVDGVPYKTLDSSGFTRFEVPPGPHQIAFRKESFEPTDRQVQFTRGQELKVSDVKLKEFGTLSFRTTPADAQITYRHNNQTGHARGGDSKRVPEGRYSITAEAQGYISQTNEVEVVSGQVATVDSKLTVIAEDKKGSDLKATLPEPSFEKPNEVKKVGEWYKNVGTGEYIFLGSVLHRFELNFVDPGKDAIGRQKKLEWVIDYVSEQQKIAYDFNGKKLTRKATLGGKPETFALACKFENGTIQFVIKVEANRVEVGSKSCEQTDSYDSSQRDLTKGKIGIKSNPQFLVR